MFTLTGIVAVYLYQIVAILHYRLVDISVSKRCADIRHINPSLACTAASGQQQQQQVACSESCSGLSVLSPMTVNPTP